MQNDDYGIEKRKVSIPQGDIVVSVTSESDGDAVFPIPVIERLNCTIVGQPAMVQFSVETRDNFDKPLFSRGFELQNIITFYDTSQRRIGYVYIEDGHPDYAEVDQNLKLDKLQVELDMLRFCQKAFAETPRGLAVLINSAVAEVEKDCLLHRAAALRIGAREMEREAILLEEEAHRLIAGALSP